MYSNVHAIGDSHVLHMGDLFHVHHICDSEGQGATAHNLIEDKSSTRSKQKLAAILESLEPARDILLLSFGEVDCRLHIRSDEAAANTVAKYGQAIASIVAMGFRVIVHGVIGAVPQDNTWRQPDYPDEVTRGHIVLAFNDYLRLWCNSHDVEFFGPDTYDDRGVLYDSMTDDGVHLNDSALHMYREFADSIGSDMRKIVWSSIAMEHFGKVTARALGWPLVVDGPIGDCDVVYIMGMYDPPTYKYTLERTERAKKRIIQWCGADAFMCNPETLPEAIHLSSAGMYSRQLLACGIEAPEVLLPISFTPEVTPFPEIPTVTCYLGSSANKYGGEMVQYLMEALPDVRFQTYHFGEYGPQEMAEIMANTTVQVQPGYGNAGCSLREALQAGRGAIGTIDYPFVNWVPHDSPQLILRKVKLALKRKEPNLEAAAYWKAANDTSLLVEAIEAAANE